MVDRESIVITKLSNSSEEPENTTLLDHEDVDKTGKPEDTLLDREDVDKASKPEDTLLDHEDLDISVISETTLRNTTGDDQKSKGTALIISKIVWVSLSITLLIVTGVNKITLMSIADELQISLENFEDSTYSNTTFDFSDDNLDIYSRPITIYWQLLIILLLPNFITLLLSLLFGCFGKSRKTFPWPNICAIVAGIIGAIAEVFCMCTFTYLVLAYVSSGASIFLLHGIFLIQTLIYAIKLSPCTSSSKNSGSEKNSFSCKRFCVFIIVFGLAFVVQVIGFILFMWLESNRFQNGKIMVFNIKFYGLLIGIPIVLFSMSLFWSNWYQHVTITPMVNSLNNISTKSKWCQHILMTLKGQSYDTSAHYKSSIINSSTRLILYIFISYIMFRFVSPFHIDPWWLENGDHKTDIVGTTGLTVLLHLLFSFIGYVLTWIICKVDKTKILAPILFFATPISVGIYYTFIYGIKITHPILYFSTSGDTFELPSLDIIGSIIIFLSGSAAMICMICLSSDNINKHDRNVFLTPYYNSIFLEQQLSLNLNLNDMNFKKQKKDNQTDSKMPRNIFVCSTMYRESECEMKQLLTSIYNMVMYLSQEQEKSHDKYESHIFFDGAITGNQIENFGLQLLSLLKKTLKIDIDTGKKVETPYGLKYSWIITYVDKENDKMKPYEMPFAIHFKNKAKVKSKKRWSQVMYMNYIIKHRMKNEELKNTFILTTDADIKFGSHSVEILLKHISSNHKLGAVCCRTHPKGNGPIYWYQIFDYAIGHWFQKPAEHMIGSVLCCPGCFSIYRCSALSEVIDEYATEISNANDFLIKDMGEDRWLCTLLIKKGHHLEYSSIAHNYTFCPSEFDELYRQRRRWIPSTVANLITLIGKSEDITKANTSISIVYILYQALLALSTAISPATVILVISAGLESFDIPPILTAVLLFIVSILYGIICTCSSPRTQLQVSKVLTFLFAILMALVAVGIIKETVDDIINTSNNLALRKNCSISNTGDICTKSNIPSQHYLPININFIYVLVLSITFITAAILHFSEKSCILHSIWFILALPSGYLLLLIYSAANICDQSWGTREQSNVNDEGILGWKKHIKKFLTVIFSCHCWSWCCASENKKMGESFLADESKRLEEGDNSHIEESLTESDENVEQVNEEDMDPKVIEWLTKHECLEYKHQFISHGYTSMTYLAGIKEKELQEIGVKKKGLRLRLQREAQKVPSLLIDIAIPDSVESWLKTLKLEEYTEIFHNQGYKTMDDIESLKELTVEKLKEMGITKRAHLCRLNMALDYLANPSTEDHRKRRTKGYIDNQEPIDLMIDNKMEFDFWSNLINEKLKPVSEKFINVADLHKSLINLRNFYLMILLIVNLIWIILLFSLRINQLQNYDVDPRAFQLLYLAVYGMIILIQLVAMLLHRGISLLHYLCFAN